MCVRLFPDIIVAAEINSHIFWDGREKPIIVSIGDCLSHQRDYTYFGFRNPFIGYEGKEWNRDDYLNYFRKLPQYFEKVEYSVWYEYKVNIEALTCEDGTINFGKLLTEGVYHPEHLECFGLLPEQQQAKLEHTQKKIGTRPNQTD